MPLFYVVLERNDAGIRQYLGSQGRELADRMRVLPCDELPARRVFEPGTYILAGLDQLGPGMLRLVCELHRELDGRPGFRFLNHPSATLFRGELLDALHRRGHNDFRAVRAGGDLAGLRYPVFLRSDRAHDGAASPLLGSRAEIEQAIGRALLRGRRLEDLLVVEFCATAGADGLYRKYAAFRVADRVVPRHLARGPDWMLKYDDQAVTREISREELEYVRSNPHRERLAEIFEIARVGYGRIDYSLSGDRIQTWEINLNPVIGQDGSPADRGPKNAIFYPAFAMALRATEVSDGAGPVSVDLDPGAREAASAERGSRPTARPPGRPAPAWIEPLARPVGRWVGRLARRLSAD